VRAETHPTDLERIRGELISALSAITAVRSIDSFGSVATGCADQWSDLDLLVSCEMPEDAAWLAAAAIRSAKHVVFYRIFTSVSQPSGRYWFYHESPFHRLDVSFCSLSERAEICRSGLRSGHQIHMLSEYVAHVPVDLAEDRKLNSPAVPIDVAARETEVGKLLYRYLESAKNQLRGLPTNRNIAETRTELLNAVSEMPIVAGGGDLWSFVAHVDEFMQRSQSEVEGGHNSTKTPT